MALKRFSRILLLATIILSILVTISLTTLLPQEVVQLLWVIVGFLAIALLTAIKRFRFTGILSRRSLSKGLSEIDTLIEILQKTDHENARKAVTTLRIKGMLTDGTLVGAKLQGSQLQNMHLSEANLAESNLQHSDMRGANLFKANLKNADLSDSILGGANLQNAVLEGAILVRVVLYGADLRNANLANAQLIDADLREASLEGANLDNAQLIGARIGSAVAIGLASSYADIVMPNGRRISNMNELVSYNMEDEQPRLLV